MAKETTEKKLYDLLSTRNYDNFQALDSRTGKIPANPESGAQDVSLADMFTFDWSSSRGKNYGTAVVLLTPDHELELYFGDNLGKTMEDPDDKNEWFAFMEQLRHFATRTNFNGFRPLNINQLRHSLQGQAAIREGLFESWQGRKNMSWSAGPTEARLMIRHKRNLDEGDARHLYIESLFIETVEGERYKLPFAKLAGGRAMLEHVRQGGKPYDIRGQHIADMVQELNVLGRFERGVARETVLEGDTAQLVSEAAVYRKTLKENLKRLGTGRGYTEYFESWNPTELSEQDVVIESLKHMFVKQTLDARIEQALPVLARIQQQGNAMKEAAIFEAWANRLVEGTWSTPDTPEAQQKLLDFMSQEQPVGADATDATEQLYDLLGDDELFDQLGELAETDPNSDCRQLVQDRMQQLSDDPDVRAVLDQLNTDADAEMNPPESLPADLGDQEEYELEEATGDAKFDTWLNNVTSKKQADTQSLGIEDIISAIDQEVADPGQHIDILYDVLNRTRDLASPNLAKARQWILRYAKIVTTGRYELDDWSIDLGRAMTPYEIVTAYDLIDFLQHAASVLEKDAKSASGKLNEFAPGGESNNGPLQYGTAIVEFSKQYSTLWDDEASAEDGEMIKEVGETFLQKGMTAGIAALFDLDTLVSDDVLHYLDKQGFDTQKDIHTPYQASLKKSRRGNPSGISKQSALNWKKMQADFNAQPGQVYNVKGYFGQSGTSYSGATVKALNPQEAEEKFKAQMKNSKFSRIEVVPAGQQGVAEDDVEDFLNAGGKITQVKPQRGPRRPGSTFASKHIGTIGGKAKSKGALSGMGANTGKAAKPVVAVEGTCMECGMMESVCGGNHAANENIKHDMAEDAVQSLRRAAGLTENVLRDSTGSTLDHIANRFKRDIRDFETTGNLSDDLYDALYDYYVDDMPYGVQKARSGDPHQWIADRIIQDLGLQSTSLSPFEQFKLRNNAARAEMGMEPNPDFKEERDPHSVDGGMDNDLLQDSLSGQIAGSIAGARLGPVGSAIGGAIGDTLTDDAVCNMTEAGESCPTHGLDECWGAMANEGILGTIAGGVAGASLGGLPGAALGGIAGHYLTKDKTDEGDEKNDSVMPALAGVAAGGAAGYALGSGALNSIGSSVPAPVPAAPISPPIMAEKDMDEENEMSRIKELAGIKKKADENIMAPIVGGLGGAALGGEIGKNIGSQFGSDVGTAIGKAGGQEAAGTLGSIVGGLKGGAAGSSAGGQAGEKIGQAVGGVAGLAGGVALDSSFDKSKTNETELGTGIGAGIGGALGGLGGAALGGIAGHYYSEKNKGAKKTAEGWKGQLAGGTVGSLAGGAAGATIGPVGAAVGSALGGTAGQMIGNKLDGEETDEGFQGAIAGGALGGIATKSLKGASAGAKLGSALQDRLSKKDDTSPLAGQYGHSGKMQEVGKETSWLDRLKELSGMSRR
jgi:hypothetical protein